MRGWIPTCRSIRIWRSGSGNRSGAPDDGFRFDGGLIVLFVEPGPGEKVFLIGGPFDHGIVQKLGAVIEI